MIELKRKIKNSIVTITDWEDEDKVSILIENNVTNYSCRVVVTHSQFEDEFDKLVAIAKQIMKDLNEK